MRTIRSKFQLPVEFRYTADWENATFAYELRFRRSLYPRDRVNHYIMILLFVYTKYRRYEDSIFQAH